jgi:lamin tail-like protein
MTSEMTRVLLVFVAACEWGGGPGPAPSARSDAKLPDAARKDAAIDSRMIDAPKMIDAAPSPTPHLLLTEICVTPDGSEFIEIYNPTTAAVDLSQYYVSNHGSYFKLPVGMQAIPFAHFIVQFPAGASIGAGEAITLATQGAAPYMTTYGAPPTYSITDGTVINTVVNGTPRLTDGGALVVLFQWDGVSPLVKDVDMMIVGAPSLTNVLVDKSGVVQNGMTYATDANSIAAQPSAPGIGMSTKRILREDGHETQTGTNNGITGHDETSEHTELTWDTSFTAPTPGVVPAL